MPLQKRDDTNLDVDVTNSKSLKEKNNEQVMYALKVLGVTTVCGFGAAALVKYKGDREDKIARKNFKPIAPDQMEMGRRLAFKALAYGSLWAIGGFSVFCYAFWKWTGATHLKELKPKVREKLPTWLLRETVIDESSNIKTWDELKDYLMKKS